MPKTQPLSLDLLRLDAGTQSRFQINDEVVADYSDLLVDNIDWPFGPVDVFHDGNDYMVADGFHRILAAQRAKRASAPCRVHKGTADDARIFGMTANDKHGVRMTRAEKRSCVEWLLDNSKRLGNGKLTQQEIAEKAGVSRTTVKTILAERKLKNGQFDHSSNSGNLQDSGKEGRTDSDGKDSRQEAELPDAADGHGESGSSPSTTIRDSNGNPVPGNLISAHDAVSKFRSICGLLDRARTQTLELSGPGTEHIHSQQAAESILKVRESIRDSAYWSHCVVCQGSGCQRCNKTGYLPRLMKSMLTNAEKEAIERNGGGA